MKLIEITENNKSSAGTYAGYHFDKTNLKTVIDWAVKNKIPNLVPINKIHTTLLYSKKPCPNYTPLGKLKTPIVAKIGKMEIWPTQDNKHALVVILNAPDIIKRHKELMKEHNASYDYDEYKPHITISYDVGDKFKLVDLSDLKNCDELKATEEYYEQLTDNWQNESN